MTQNFPEINSEKILEKQEGVKNLKFPEIIPNHFCWSVVGQPGSGKTTFIEQIMNDETFYKNKFDYIFIISQSPIKIDNVDSECITKEFNITWIYDRINYLNNKNIANCNLLIIIDDCVSQIGKQENNQQLIDLFFNRRHIWHNNTISIIMTTQQHYRIPLRFRNICDSFTFLSLSPRDLEFIKKDLIPLSQRNLVSEHVQHIEKHQFLYIRISPFLVCLNFKPLISGSEYVSQSGNFDSLEKSKCSQALEKNEETEIEPTLEVNEDFGKKNQKNSHHDFIPTEKFSFVKYE